MAKPHEKLRNIIGQHDMTEADLAAELDIDVSTMSRKLMGHTPWTSAQMWRIMEMFAIPDKQLHLVFPPKGLSKAPKRTA